MVFHLCVRVKFRARRMADMVQGEKKNNFLRLRILRVYNIFKISYYSIWSINMRLEFEKNKKNILYLILLKVSGGEAILLILHFF